MTHKLFNEIKTGKHIQFVLKKEIECKCGQKAIWWKTDYICRTVTAYPCKYNKL